MSGVRILVTKNVPRPAVQPAGGSRACCMQPVTRGGAPAPHGAADTRRPRPRCRAHARRPLRTHHGALDDWRAVAAVAPASEARAGSRRALRTPHEASSHSAAERSLRQLLGKEGTGGTMSNNRHLSRIEAFKRGEYPYGQMPPGTPVTEARAELAQQRELDRRFEASRARAARERAELVAYHRLLGEAARLLPIVYGPPSGQPHVVECVKTAQQLARAGQDAGAALQRAAVIAHVPMLDVLECLRAMRGARARGGSR
jgi:hypothetical protein